LWTPKKGGSIYRQEVHMNGSKQRRAYTPEFKAEVVTLIGSSDKSVAQLCRELDVPETTVHKWLDHARVDAGERVVLTTSEHDELIRLRRKVCTLEEQQLILKKALAFFARET
jgi:transposase-like protein